MTNGAQKRPKSGAPHAPRKQEAKNMTKKTEKKTGKVRGKDLLHLDLLPPLSSLQKNK